MKRCIDADIVSEFLGTLTETEGYVEGEWPEYEALMRALGWFE